jgi:hypothetical protein
MAMSSQKLFAKLLDITDPPFVLEGKPLPMPVSFPASQNISASAYWISRSP